MLIDLSSEELRKDPYAVYRWLRDEAPVYRLPEGQILVSRYDDVSNVLRAPKQFSSAPMGGMAPYLTDEGTVGLARGSLIGADPPDHTRQRKLVARTYLRRSVGAFETTAQAIAHELAASAAIRGEFDVLADFATPLVDRMNAAVLGVDLDDFRTLARASTGQVATSESSECVSSILSSARGVTTIVGNRGRLRADDLPSTLVAGCDAGDLSIEELYATLFLITVSGTEETPLLIANAVLALLEHPDELAAFRAGQIMAQDIVEETLRYDPPVQMVMRRTTAPVDLAGEQIPASTVVLAILASANRDERQFLSPDRFWPQRAAGRHLGFGLANHLCLGASLARMVAKIGLQALFARLDGVRMAPGPLVRRSDAMFRGPVELRLDVTANDAVKGRREVEMTG